MRQAMVFQTRSEFSRILRVFGVIALVPLAAEAGSTSEDAPISRHWQSSQKPTYVAGKGAARFNWLATKPSDENNLRTAWRRGTHTGSYVCSPAGFGRKSYCRARPGANDD